MASLRATSGAAASCLRYLEGRYLLSAAVPRMSLNSNSSSSSSSSFAYKQCMLPNSYIQDRATLWGLRACRVSSGLSAASLNNGVVRMKCRYCSMRSFYGGPWSGGPRSGGPRSGGPLKNSATEEKTLYSLLGVKKDESAQGIRTAYLRLAKRLHPDANVRCTDRKDKEKQFKEIKEAYELLSDPEKRKEYDESIKNINNKQTTTEAAENDYEVYRHSRDIWYDSRDELGEEFWSQVNQIKREKEMAWRTMREQRHAYGNRDEEEAARRRIVFGPAFAIARALPLLVLPMILFFAVYRHSRAKARHNEIPFTPIYRDELGRAFLVDSHGRHYRVMELDSLRPTGPH